MQNKEKGVKCMIDYDVYLDKDNDSFIIRGPFGLGTIPITIPNDNPLKKQFIDLFLHKADIERGIDFLQCISIDKDVTINEGLFIAGLNNCMKCFKYSKSRSHLDKLQIFQDAQLYQEFISFETMRDKHFDHDESGMLQAVAFLLVNRDSEEFFAGPPSVVWNRAMLNYYAIGQALQQIMQYVRNYIINQIDIIGKEIMESYISWPREKLLEWEETQIQLASNQVERRV